jgi:hypothetical protein
MSENRKYVRLREQGRRLASRRDDLIVPPHPTEPTSRRVGRHAELPDPGADDAPPLESDFARVWMIVVVACVVAFAGCIAAAGAMLMVTQVPTWHVWAAFIAGLGWAGFAVAAGRVVQRLHRQARDGDLR